MTEAQTTYWLSKHAGAIWAKNTQKQFKKKKKKLSGRLPMHLKAFARAMQGYEGYSQLECT